MDFSFSELNYNSVETLPDYLARAAFTVNSASVFKEEVDIVPTIVDENLSYIPWGCDNRQAWSDIFLFCSFFAGVTHLLCIFAPRLSDDISFLQHKAT